MTLSLEERVDEDLGEPCLGGMTICLPLLLMNLQADTHTVLDIITQQMFLTHPSLKLLEATMAVHNLLCHLFLFRGNLKEEEEAKEEERQSRFRQLIRETFARLNPSLGK